MGCVKLKGNKYQNICQILGCIFLGFAIHLTKEESSAFINIIQILSIKGTSLIINTSKCKDHFTFTSNTLSLPAYINIVVFHETKRYQSHHQSSGTWGTHFPLQLYRPAYAKNGGIYCEICR